MKNKNRKRTQKIYKEEKTFQKTTNMTKINRNMKRLSGWIVLKIKYILLSRDTIKSSDREKKKRDQKVYYINFKVEFTKTESIEEHLFMTKLNSK